MDNDITERALWALISHLSWWYWVPLCLLAASCLWGVYGLAPVQSRLGIWIRVSLYAGLLLTVGSIANRPFVYIAMPFILLGLRGWLWQTRRECLRTGKIKKPEGSLAVRVASTLVVPPH